jgi:hypothetical protein
MITLPDKCPRGLDFCQPYGQILSTDGSDFVCCGHLEEEYRNIPQDRFRLCWKTKTIDEMGDYDRRDLTDTLSVIAQALSVDANIEANNEKV